MARSGYKIYKTTHQAWDAMLEAIKHAEKSIYWQVYIFVDDDIGGRFFTLLEKKAGEGVDVKLVMDYWGSFALSKKRIDNLRKNGIDIRLFQERKNKMKGFWERFSVRTHRKVLIIDEKNGFIGGVNVQKEMGNWLDIHMRVQGKVVRSLLRYFAKFYISCGGPKKEVKHLLKYKYRVESDSVDLVYDQPQGMRSKARKKYTEALLKARERVILFSPYYFPDKQFIKALWQAKKRGVRVDLLIPLRTDLRFATYAAYAWFSIMKKAGVRIHILKKNMMHGKGVIMDDEWAMIGSSNIDHVSFFQNYEANVHLKSKNVVKKLKRILESWMEEADELQYSNWRKRSRWHKIKEWIAIKIYRYWFNIK